MANRFMNQFVLTMDKKQVLIAGNVSLSSAAAVSASDVNDLVESITRTGVGAYLITLKDKYVSLKSVQLQYSGNENIDVQSIVETVSSNRTIAFNTRTNGTVADVTAACKIYFSIILKDSTAR